MGEPESGHVGGAEELKCPRKHTNCHPLDLIASGDDFTCCGARDPSDVSLFPYCVCVVGHYQDARWYYNETQLLNMVSVITRSLASVRE